MLKDIVNKLEILGCVEDTIDNYLYDVEREKVGNRVDDCVSYLESYLDTAIVDTFSDTLLPPQLPQPSVKEGSSLKL